MKIGGFLVETGGYEQTNVDFYEIVDIKNKTVTLQKVGNKVVDGLSDMSARVVPNVDNKIGETFKKRIMADRRSGNEYCKMDYYRAYIWDEKPMFCSWWY